MRLWLCVAAVCVALTAPACKGKKNSEDQAEVKPKKKTRTSSDPAEQALLLDEAIRIREKKLESGKLASPAADKLKKELEILHANRKRIQAKLR